MPNRSRSITAAAMQLLPALLGVFAATAPAQTRAEAPVGETRYTCCNMRAGKDWISDINYDEEGMNVVPYGTPVKILEVANNRVRIEIDGKPFKFNNDYSRKLGMPEFIRRYLLVDDPRPAQKDLSEGVRQAIGAFTVVPGMTREQVLLAIAYPIADETPNLKADVWKYWQLHSIEYDIQFDASGVATDVLVNDESTHEGDVACAANVYRPDWSRGVDGTHMHVQVDGKVSGRLRTGDTMCLKLPAGKHKVEIRSEILFQPAMVVAEMDVEVPANANPQFLRFHRTFTTPAPLASGWLSDNKLTTATAGQWRKRQ
jgi:hypothetical protein